jgi:hypothetical protein
MISSPQLLIASLVFFGDRITSPAQLAKLPGDSLPQEVMSMYYLSSMYFSTGGWVSLQSKFFLL